jgi:hypothetical protein
MANKHMKNAKIISFRETQIKATVRDSYTAMRMVTTPCVGGDVEELELSFTAT